MKILTILTTFRSILIFYIIFIFFDKYLEVTKVNREVAVSMQNTKYLPDNSIKSLRDFLESSGVLFPDVAIAQIILETGRLSSAVYRECNNLFGMKLSSRRIASTSCRGHAGYNHPYDSILDYRAWQTDRITYYRKKYGPVDTEEDYLLLLKRMNYAEDPLYVPKLKRILYILRNSNLIER